MKLIVRQTAEVVEEGLQKRDWVIVGPADKHCAARDSDHPRVNAKPGYWAIKRIYMFMLEHKHVPGRLRWTPGDIYSDVSLIAGGDAVESVGARKCEFESQRNALSPICRRSGILVQRTEERSVESWHSTVVIGEVELYLWRKWAIWCTAEIVSTESIEHYEKRIRNESWITTPQECLHFMK